MLPLRESVAVIVPALIISYVVSRLLRTMKSSEEDYNERPKDIAPEEELNLSRCSCVIKLGGSACTIKDTVQDILVDNPLFKPFILHGAGSFGHFQAKQYAIAAGTLSDTGKPKVESELISSFLREGFARTRRSVTTLNQHILTTFIEKGVAAVGISPFPVFRVENRKVALGSWQSAMNQCLSQVLDLGLVPLMHGDACMDISDRRTSICSGDSLFVYLCDVFRPPHAVFLADVDGVLTSPPGSVPEPEIIREIRVHANGEWTTNSQIVTSSAEHDVTGGMKQKIKAAIEVVFRFRIPVYIVKAGTVHAVSAMRGILPELGTVVRFIE